MHKPTMYETFLGIMNFTAKSYKFQPYTLSEALVINIDGVTPR